MRYSADGWNTTNSFSGVCCTNRQSQRNDDERRTNLEREHVSFTDSSSEFDDGLEVLDLSFDRGIEIFLSYGREGEEVNRSDVGTDVHSRGVGREERSQSLVDVFGEERNESGLFLQNRSALRCE